MKLSVFGPVKNEAQFIGYSIMDSLEFVHEFVYACADSDDGTIDLLEYIKGKYAGEKLKILRSSEFDFNPHDLPAYNNAFNACIKASTGDAVWFKHPDMIVTNPEVIKDMKPAMAWWTNIKSFAGDFDTQITKGRATRWKNIAMKKMGLTYYGEYGSQNEDLYFKDITGDSYKHYGESFGFYPYKVLDSGLNVNHYCELKPYKRRFEKMKACLKTLHPGWSEESIANTASKHPRVTLEGEFDAFGKFEFTPSGEPQPAVFQKYKEEFEQIIGGVPA